MRAKKGLLFVVLFSACAPSLGKQLRVDNIIQSEPSGAPADAEALPRVRVGTFEDRRPYSEVGEVDGRQLQPSGNVALNVQTALEEMLSGGGLRPSQFSGPVLSGQILEWRVKVQPGFPTTTVYASAEVKVELRDQNHALIYAATYSGNGEAEHPMMSQARVEKALGEAMQTALSGIIEDRDLRSRIK